MNNVKGILFFMSALFFSGILSGQNEWVTDTEMQFKIKAPSNYRQKQMRDGTD